MFARAPDEGTKAANNQNGKRPLYFRCVIAEPKERKRNNDCRCGRDKREPGNLPFVGKPGWSFRLGRHQNWNRQLRHFVASTRSLSVSATPTGGREHAKNFGVGDLKFSKAILLQSPVKRASAQAQRLCRLARVAVISGQRFFDQECFDLFETHLFDVARFAPADR
jgi:hypothetical protein